MFYEKIGEEYAVDCKGYTVKIKNSSFEVMQKDESSQENEAMFDFNVRSNMATVTEHDIDEAVLTREVSETENVLVVKWKTRSNLWELKEYILECRENACLYYITVKRSGRAHV